MLSTWTQPPLLWLGKRLCSLETTSRLILTTSTHTVVSCHLQSKGYGAGKLNILVLEHDGSLSRNDVYFGDNHSFNETIWETVASHFNQSTISIQTAATARKERIQAAAAVNPAFAMSASDVRFSFIETALYLSIFGSVEDGNAVTEWVRVMFRKSKSLKPVKRSANTIQQNRSVCLFKKDSRHLRRSSRRRESWVWWQR